MRFLPKLIGFLLVAVLVLAVAVLAWGHVQIRGIHPRLPSVEEVLTVDRSADLPVRLTWIDTASQRMPRSAVLDPDSDPDPDAEYTMSHASFAVEWQDGRIFLIDLGMEPEAAADFGAPLETFMGADPIVPHEATSAALGKDRERVEGIGFTHMHVDHTGGLLALCRDLGPRGMGIGRVPVFQTYHQLARVNHTTRAAKRQLEDAKCIERRSLGSDSGLVAVPGFDGLFAIPAGGHTPGSTLWVVQLRTAPGKSRGRHDDVQTWVVTGDIVNHVAGIEKDLSKPRLYSLLVVPEDGARLGKLRAFLATLAGQPGVRLLVSHDLRQLESAKLPTR